MRGSISCYAAAALASDRVLVTVTGPDRTGVTATLTGILSQQGATLHDIEQVVVQGQLTLCLLIGVPETRDVLKELLFAAKQLEMELDFKPVPADPTAPVVAQKITPLWPTRDSRSRRSSVTWARSTPAKVRSIPRASIFKRRSTLST